MIVVENNVFDDVEVKLYLLENDDDHDIYKVMYDVEKFEQVELMMIDLLK